MDFISLTPLDTPVRENIGPLWVDPDAIVALQQARYNASDGVERTPYTVVYLCSGTDHRVTEEPHEIYAAIRDGDNEEDV